jgi:hypothetical protein
VEAAALKSPPEWLEQWVLRLTPPGAREAVVGDLCETFSSPSQYAFEALRTVPFVIVSQMRRNANLPALMLQGFLVFVCLGGLAPAEPGHARGIRIAAPLLVVLGLLLQGAYQATGRPSARRAMMEAIAIPYCALLSSQIVTLGMAVMQHVGDDLLLWLRFGYLAPLMLPVLCLLRTALIVQRDGQRPFPADTVSRVDIESDYGQFAKRIRRRNRGEAVLLGVAALLAAFLLRLPPGIDATIGLVLLIVYGLAALYLLVEGAAPPLPEGADFLSLRALYAHELTRQQQLRRFLWWLWLAPVLIVTHAKLTAISFAASEQGATLLGSAAALLLCFFISALNREQGGWVQEKIGLLDRMRETQA